MNDRQRAFLIGLIGSSILGALCAGLPYLLLGVILLNFDATEWPIYVRAVWVVSGIIMLGGWLIWRALARGE